jgi:putative NADH-flavin reductase
MHMKLLIIGANRGMGRRLVELALDESHTVTALVRNPEQLTVRHDRLSVIKGDIRDKEAVNRAVEDQDAVCITIGINPTRKPVTVFSEGAKTVIESPDTYRCKSADLCHRYRRRRQQKSRRFFLRPNL